MRSKALEGKKYCDRLFLIEKKINEEMKLEGKDKLNKRIEIESPVLYDFNRWLKICKELTKSALGKAVSYALNQ